MDESMSVSSNGICAGCRKLLITTLHACWQFVMISALVMQAAYGIRLVTNDL